jgi:hypothetical protein
MESRWKCTAQSSGTFLSGTRAGKNYLSSRHNYRITQAMSNAIKAEASTMPRAESNPVSDEKETLKREILEELERDSLKKEILEELKPTTRKDKFSRFIQHPAFLLLFGFFLTGVVGIALTAYWNRLDWNYQQDRLQKIQTAGQNIKRKNDVKDKIKSEVEDALSADLSVLTLILSESSNSTRGKEIETDLEKWRQSEEHWNANSENLKQTIAGEFSNKATPENFQKIIKGKVFVDTNVNGILTTMVNNKWKMMPDDYNDVRKVNDEITQVRGNLNQVLTLMSQEIESDEATANKSEGK